MMPGAPGEWDAVDVLNPSVLRQGDAYYNFYSGYDGQTWHTGLAVSPDGIAWHHDRETVWVANALRGECVRVAEGGRVLERAATSQHTLSCLVAGPDGRTLYAATVPTDDPVRAGEINGGRIETFQLEPGT